MTRYIAFAVCVLNFLMGAVSMVTGEYDRASMSYIMGVFAYMVARDWR